MSESIERVETQITREPNLLVAEWEILADACAHGSAFMSPSWLLAYLEAYNETCRPLFLEARAAGRLVGLAPLMVTRRAGMRVLTFLGQPVNGSNAILTLPGWEAPAGRAIWSCLRECQEWDMLELAGRPAGLLLPPLLPEDEASLAVESIANGAELRLPESHDEYLASLTRKRRFQARYYWDRLRAEHDAQFVVLTTPGAIAAAIGEFSAARGEAYASRPGYLSRLQRSTRYQAFLADASTRCAEHGGVALTQIRVSGRPCASILCYRERGGLMVYQRTYDRRFGALSPGSALDVLLVRYAIEKGCRTLDLGPGIDAYKERLGAVRYDRCAAVVARRTVRGRLVRLLHGAEGRGAYYSRRARSRIRSRLGLPA